MGEHTGIAGLLRDVDLIGVQRVVVARYPAIHHDLRARQILRNAFDMRVADLELACLQCHGASPQLRSTGRSVVTPTLRAVTTSSPFWSRYSAIRSRNVSLPARLLSRSHVLPGLVSTVTTSPRRSGRGCS